MIVGDHIVTTQLQLGRVPQRVEVIAIEKHEICWRAGLDILGGYDRFGALVLFPDGKWLVTGALVITHGGMLIGRVRKRDRGLTWAPAWREDEVKLLCVTAALGPETT